MIDRAHLSSNNDSSINNYEFIKEFIKVYNMVLITKDFILNLLTAPELENHVNIDSNLKNLHAAVSLNSIDMSDLFNIRKFIDKIMLFIKSAFKQLTVEFEKTIKQNQMLIQIEKTLKEEFSEKELIYKSEIEQMTKLRKIKTNLSLPIEKKEKKQLKKEFSNFGTSNFKKSNESSEKSEIIAIEKEIEHMIKIKNFNYNISDDKPNIMFTRLDYESNKKRLIRALNKGIISSDEYDVKILFLTLIDIKNVISRLK